MVFTQDVPASTAFLEAIQQDRRRGESGARKGEEANAKCLREVSRLHLLSAVSVSGVRFVDFDGMSKSLNGQ